MKISVVKKGRRPPIYGWLSNGTCFLSPYAAGTVPRPANEYATKEEAEAEAAARGREIMWEDAVDG